MSDDQAENKFDKLTPEQKAAVNWFAAQSLALHVLIGTPEAKHRERFLDGAREHLSMGPQVYLDMLVKTHQNDAERAAMEEAMRSNAMQALRQSRRFTDPDSPGRA